MNRRTPIAIVAGTRPNFVKVAPLVRALGDAGLPFRLIHTGQHGDPEMSGAFCDELGLPPPDVRLSPPEGNRLEAIQGALEREFGESRPAAVVVVGDVDSTLAAARAAHARGVPIAHVEAGLRSFDPTMPEERNRVAVDALARWHFATEPAAVHNLAGEGAAPERVHLVGNVMIDTLLSRLGKARRLAAAERLGLRREGFVLLTLHRPANVDDPDRLETILRAAARLARDLPVIFPVHPRTRRRLAEFGLEGVCGPLVRIAPQTYTASLALLDAARLVLTDSGGIQEETTALRVPCLTIRDNTERPITVERGSNRLVGRETEGILRGAAEALAGPPRLGEVPELWDGRTARRIAAVLRGEV